MSGVILLGFAVVAPLVQGNSTVLLVAYGALIVGFFTFIFGTQQHAKWSRKPRADEALDQMLNRLNDRFTLIHFPELGGHAPDHVLVTPGGVVAITTRDIQGNVTVEGRQWRQQRLFLARFFNLGSPSLGNPTIENEYQLDRLESIFDEQALPGELEGVIVFISDDVEIEMHDVESTVVHLSELPDLAREIGADVQLGNEDRNQIVDALAVGEEMETIGARSSRPKKRIKVAQ